MRIPLGTATVEEVAFRAVLLAAFSAVTGWWWAAGWAAVTFGLWHVGPTVTTLRLNDVDPRTRAGVVAVLAAVLATTVGGLGFAWLRQVSGSVLACVLGHWAFNALGLLAAAVTQRTRRR